MADSSEPVIVRKKYLLVEYRIFRIKNKFIDKVKIYMTIYSTVQSELR